MSVAPASVLAVEDDPVVRADLRLVLADAGFTLVPDARDGYQAVALAREYEPDVILLDLGLPRIGGVEAVRRILAEREVPIVALTGRSKAHAEEAVAAGAVSYVLKPFAGPDVVDALRDALAVRREQELRAESLEALGTLVELIGYPSEWAMELERRAWEQGHIWRISGSGGWRQA